MFGVGARFIIFIGAIVMVQVEFKDKWLPRGYPATVGRRNRVLRLARRLREHTGARLGGDLTA